MVTRWGLAVGSVVLGAALLGGCRQRSAEVAAFEEGRTEPSQPVPAQFAGVRYPAAGVALEATVADLLNKSGRPAPGPVLALVVPHAAITYAGPEIAEGFAAVRDRRFDRIVVLSPAHVTPVSGAVMPAHRSLATPLGDLPIDSVAAATLVAQPGFRRDDTPFRGEHGIEDVLPFLQKAVGAVPVVPLLVGGDLDVAHAAQLADGLRQVVDARTLVVVSTNLTEYGERFHNTSFGDDAKGKTLLARMRQEDEILLDPLAKADLPRFDALARAASKGKAGKTAFCGQDALRVLLALLPRGSTGIVRRYGTSNDLDTSRPDEAASYAALAYPGAWPEVPPLGSADRDALLAFARGSLEAQVNGAAAPTPAGLGPRLSERHGVFVTVVKAGEVRACVGRPESDDPVWQAAGEVARQAATADARFPPIARDELGSVKLEVSVLGPLRPLKHLEDLRLGVDGLYVGLPGHAGLVLPQVASDLHLSFEQFLAEAEARVGVPRDQWPLEALRAFTVTVVAEPGAQLAPTPKP